MSEQQSFEDLINEAEVGSMDINMAMLEAAAERDRFMLKLRCVEIASEYQQKRIEFQGDKHGGDLIRLAAGIHNWISKDEIKDLK